MNRNDIDIMEQAQNLKQKLVHMRRDFHRHPELSNEEYQTTEKIEQYLAEMGIEILPTDLETGVVAKIQNGDGPTVALRADIDALPMQEETELSFASKHSGIMHACGHDAHITWVLGAAMLLNNLRNYLNGEVRFIFQPAEEKVSGAKKVIEAGGLDEVDIIFGAHNKPDLEAGTVGLKPGYLMASTGSFEVNISGKGGHGAAPHLSKDPMPALGNILMSVNSIVGRNVDPLESAVISVCKIRGGTASNIIPPKVIFEGTMRAYKSKVKNLILSRLKSLIKNAAQTYDCKASINRMKFGVPAVDNDDQSVEIIKESAIKLLGTTAVQKAIPVLASEDFSVYQQQIPGCFFWIGSGNKKKNIDRNWHHPQFTIDESCLAIGAGLFARVAADAMIKLSD